MMRFERESLLADPVSRHLRRLRFRTVYREAPFGEYNIDLLGHSPTNGVTVAVELKLAKWQRAFEQALVYQLCADFSYVAMPRLLTGRVPLSRFEEHGIGLLAVDGRGCHVLLPAARSSVVHWEHKEHVLRRVEEFSCLT